jgi:hypothetical protein
VTTSWTCWGPADERSLTLFTFPLDSLARFPPCASKLLQLFLNFRVAIGLHVSRVAIRPLLQFGWFSWAFGTSDMSTLLADCSRGRRKHGVALVAGASDSLFRWLICEFIASPGCDGQDSLLLRLFINHLFLLFLHELLLLRVTRTLLASFMLTLQADFLRSVDSSTMVTVAMDAHANRLFDALHGGHWSRGSNPFMRVEGETVLCKQCTSSFLLHGMAIELFCHNSGCRWRLGGSDGGGRNSWRRLRWCSHAEAC